MWENKRIAILGGANMIGVELTKQILAKPPKALWVVDDLSAGKREWLPHRIGFHESDLRNPVDANNAVRNADVVFVLACRHGGRGYVSSHASELYDNFSLSATILRACDKQKVERVIVTSSACAYPIHIQMNIEEDLKLNESLIDYRNTQHADGMYGMEKLLLEIGLNAYIDRGSFEGVVCRLFTVYDHHVSLTHALGAMMAKFMLKQSPFEIWGDGQQKRNWTHCEDICRGLILAAEKGRSGQPYNIGSEEINTPLSAFEYLSEIVGWKPEVKLLLDKPVGPYNRIADSQKAYDELGWKPKYTLKDGLNKAFHLFQQLHDVKELQHDFERKLTEL